MANEELFFHTNLGPRQALELERWGGLLALCVLSGSATVIRLETLRDADPDRERAIGAEEAFLVLGPGRLSLETGERGAELVAFGTSDSALIDAIRPNAEPERSMRIDFTDACRFRRLAERVTEKSPLERLSAYHERLSCLARLFAGPAGGPGDGLPKDGVPKDTDYADRALEIFRLNVEAPLRLRDVAWKLGITEEYFVKVFRARLGMPPMAYFRNMKMEEAERLLSEGSYSVKEVSWKLGFASQHHFSRIFKAIRGHTPGERRSAAKGGPDASPLDDLGQKVDTAPDP